LETRLPGEKRGSEVDSPRPTGAFIPKLISPRRTFGNRTLNFSRQVAVMAIINRTPDSFHDRGRTYALDKAAEAVDAAVAAGADWVDIGGVPFSPDVPPVSEAEEIDRVIPLVEVARKHPDLIISVDSYRTGVARHAIEAGANVVNDTSGLHDPALAELVAGTDASLIITHSLASPPGSKVVRPTYRDVTAEVADFLASRVDLARSHGVPADRIIIDPGHDLNKNTYHSLELTRRLAEITVLGYPTLVAVSNKDFIGETLDAPLEQRLEGTLATLVACVLQGARIVRVHDVRATVAATRMTEAVLGLRPPAYTQHNM
jgi:dihydropteroate synthase